MLLGVQLSDVGDQELLLGEPLLILDHLLVVLGELTQGLDGVFVVGFLLGKVVEDETISPVLLVQVEKHLLLELVLAVTDADRVVIAVETMDQGLDGGLVEVTDVGSGLTGFTDGELWADGTEGINDDLSLDTLNGINDDSDSTTVELLETLLSADIDSREPASESRVRVVPSDNSLRTASLFEHVEHVLLEDLVDGLDTDACSLLGHGKDVDTTHSVLVDKLTEHQAHDLERNTSPSVFEHLEECKGGDKDSLRVVHHLALSIGKKTTDIHCRVVCLLL
mmetsp:Transcript_16222/g.26568  ORF Transcript_16222/g.26568 Transcript_16222/m.26568 type:complete len:280 (-) Transcript_16222:40-879(-)